MEMSATIGTMNDLAASCCGALLRATWQGGLAIAAAWVLARCRPPLPPRVGCWLWRLVDGKLPSSRCSDRAAAAAPPAPPDRPTRTSPATGVDPRPGRHRAWPLDRTRSRLAAGSSTEDQPRLVGVLFLLWLTGASAALIRAGRAGSPRSDCGGRARRDPAPGRWPRSGAGPGAWPSAYPRAAGRCGRRPADARRPVPAGSPAAPHDARRRPGSDAIRPVPGPRAGPCPTPRPAGGRPGGAGAGAFFFHPLVWLAHREALLAREAACDALALEASGVRPAEYADPPGDRGRRPGAPVGGRARHGRLGGVPQAEAHGR